MSARLSAEKVGDVETGSYSAGDKLDFTLEPYGDKYLLRFADRAGKLCAERGAGDAGRPHPAV